MYMVVRLELVLWTKSQLLTGISCAHSACIPTRIWSSFCLQMSMPLSVLDHQLVGTIVNSLHSASLTRQSVSLVDLSQCQNLKIDKLMDTGICQTLLSVPESESWLPKIQPSKIIFLPTWWRHQMETFSVLLAICAGNSPVPGEFPTQRPVTRSFDVFFDLCLNKQLSKQW